MTDNCESEKNQELSKSFNDADYAELLDYYRQGCPNTPAEILEKVASIYWGSLVCMDTADIVQALSHPGKKAMITEDVADRSQWIPVANKLCHQILDQWIDPAYTGYIVGIMLVNTELMKSSCLKEYVSVVNSLRSHKLTDDDRKIIFSLSIGESLEPSGLTLIFSGVGASAVDE